VKLALIVLVVLVTGCSPVLYYGVKQTRTYEYERRVPVLVESDPAGATITSSDGTVLGQAPLVLEEKVRVRRKHRSLNPGMALLGCVADIGVFVPTTIYWNDHRDDTLARAGLALGVGMLTGCIGLAVIKLYNLGIDPGYRALQSPPLFTSATRTDEVVVARNVEVVARWSGLGEARRALALPAQTALTLRLPRRYTFDEALALWDRSGERPPTSKDLYQLGHAYRRLALAGTRGAAQRAIELFERYLGAEAVLEHSDEVRRLVEELRAGAPKP
jgi:hypothetical protein